MAANPLRFDGFDRDSAVKAYDMLARDDRPSVGRCLRQAGNAAAMLHAPRCSASAARGSPDATT